MGLPDLFILISGIHQVGDIHLLKSSFTPEKRQKIAAPVASRRCQDAPSVKFQMEVIIKLEAWYTEPP